MTQVSSRHGRSHHEGMDRDQLKHRLHRGREHSVSDAARALGVSR